MKTKLFSIVVILVLLPFNSGISQNLSLKEALDDYMLLLPTKNIEKLVDYMYPKFFETFPREQITEELRKAYSDPTFQIDFKDSKVGKISEIVENDGSKYAIADYSSLLLMKINDPEADESMLDYMNMVFRMQYGEDNVKTRMVRMLFLELL